MRSALGSAVLITIAVCLVAPAARADQVKGAEVFKAKCATCHGVDGKGETTAGKAMKVKDLASDDIQKQHDSEMKTVIEEGRNKMPAYKGKLTNQQIEDLIQFIRTLRKK
jgi:cytochrome c6